MKAHCAERERERERVRERERAVSYTHLDVYKRQNITNTVLLTMACPLEDSTFKKERSVIRFLDLEQL